jgi:transcriptional regulator with XRE-family HTH domain
MELIRIGEKLVSVPKAVQVLEAILKARSTGLSQAEVAAQFNVDRAFVSRLETLAEVRKGRSIAVIGLPVANGRELAQVGQRLGVDFMWFMTDQERRAYAQSKNGIELINEILGLAQQVRQYDTVVLMASNARVRLLSALLDTHAVVPVVLGSTPLTQDVYVEPERFAQLVRQVQA